MRVHTSPNINWAFSGFKKPQPATELIRGGRLQTGLKNELANAKWGIFLIPIRRRQQQMMLALII
jgi:hypothetical protein